MARPMTNIDAGRAQLLDVFDHLIRKRGGVAVTLSELAAEAGMSPANIYRFFANKEALYEASAERWFTPKIRIMEEVVGSDDDARTKLQEFFVRRYRLMRDNYLAEPDVFVSYLDLGDQFEDIVRGYVDLGDHYLAMIVAQAMEEGHFKGLTIDRAVSLINLMALSFIDPRNIISLMHSLTEEKVREIIDVILIGLSATTQVRPTPRLAIV